MQRVNLNLVSRRIEDELAGPLSTLSLTLGDPSLSVALRAAQLLPLFNGVTLLAPAELQFAAKPLTDAGAIDFAANNVVTGSASIETIPAIAQIVSLDEDWKSVALVALFATNPASVKLKAQFRWRNGAETAWLKSAVVTVAVANSLFADDFAPGAVAIAGDYLYLKTVDSLTGSSTSLDQVRIAQLPVGTLLKIVIAGEGASEWRKESIADPAPVSGNGIVVPVDFNAGTMSYVLVKQ